ncbi:MAG: succinate dehydrogenase assembly factor 4, partial [Pseudomonadota bacterium]|nr:succinate dehydrogenase assembly factor 4 [Pseudomonadota bacterium]
TVPANLDPRFAAPAEPPRQFDANGEAVEIGGSDGPEPTRFGDWERNGRCTDF